MASRPSRRSLLRACAAGALCGAAGAEAGSRVVISRGNPDSLGGILDRALQGLYGVDSPLEAWKKIVKPGETVGLKVNCLAGRGSASTSIALVEAIHDRLQRAGIPKNKIIVWDRLASDMERAGFHGKGFRCVGNDEAGYEDDLAVWGRAGSLLSRTLTRTCDGVINVPVLKDHGIVGVTMALKNFFGAIHNPNKYHSNAGDPYVADVYMLPPIRQKTRLTICDAIAPQFEGGPSFMPHWAWPFHGVIVSRDPVALDYTGWQIIERERAARGLKPLRLVGREPLYIARAADAQHRIGIAEPARIATMEV